MIAILYNVKAEKSKLILDAAYEAAGTTPWHYDQFSSIKESLSLYGDRYVEKIFTPKFFGDKIYDLSEKGQELFEKIISNIQNTIGPEFITSQINNSEAFIHGRKSRKVISFITSENLDAIKKLSPLVEFIFYSGQKPEDIKGVSQIEIKSTDDYQLILGKVKDIVGIKEISMEEIEETLRKQKEIDKENESYIIINSKIMKMIKAGNEIEIKDLSVPPKEETTDVFAEDTARGIDQSTEELAGHHRESIFGRQVNYSDMASSINILRSRMSSGMPLYQRY